MTTAEGIGRRAPRRSRAGKSLLPARYRATVDGKMECRRALRRSHREFINAGKIPSDGDGHRYWPPRPSQKTRRDFLVSG